MALKYEEKKTIKEVIERIPINRTCDICRKAVDPKNWFRMTTSHHDWGNDSIDSLQHYDACSRECVIHFSEGYLRVCENDWPNTRELQIEHRNSLGTDNSDFYSYGD